ncbi:branched-chain amino acid ABC transporter permease [Burkholderia sp. FERM BP-3421]|jgi:branched-chain amino acid transport system permease protein|uniref:branched-chain amino acid ABC transporter permease n=1 Tax=Burkholderia sp. FERM BP-3421 TaxID=1494466 RepID=UPI0023609553|nr:branched-chain amino acid ABC transporter permease [Burkholderia sp. FERM BP-3421]WDD95794.1 branched-chain amino acid ABC transporter permease [Burkholderia sp. FERM BP-3421]
MKLSSVLPGPTQAAAAAPRPAGNRRPLVAMLGTLALLALAVPLLADAYWLKTLTSALILGIAAAGVAMLYRQLGLVCLSQYALLGVGGWVALRLAHLGAPFELCVLAGGLAGSVLGMIAGLPALRLRGLYLALVTLMMAGGFQVMVSAIGFPDGGDGFTGHLAFGARQMMARPPLGQGDAAYFRYVAAWAALAFALLELHRRAKAGRSWALIRRGETTALAAGVNIVLYQTWAFGLAGLLAGLAGGLLAGSVGQLDGRAFAASESVLLFALTVVGGVYHWFGALLAGLLLRAVPALLTDFGVNGYLAMIFFGAALLHAFVTAPAGIAGQLAGLAARVGAWRSARGHGGAR